MSRSSSTRFTQRPAVWTPLLTPWVLALFATVPIAVITPAPVVASNDAPVTPLQVASARSTARQATTNRERELDRQRACAPFLAWADAGPMPYYSGFRAPPDAVVSVLRADRFAPHLGKRYEALSPTELRQLSQTLGRCFHSNGPTSKMDARQRTLLAQALNPRDQPAHISLLAAAAQTDAELTTLAKEALNLEPTQAGLDRWMKIAESAAPNFARSPAAVREPFQQNMRSADARVVATVLPQVITQALDSEGVEGLRTLTPLANHNFGPPLSQEMAIFSPVGVDVRKQSRERVQARIAQLAAKLATAERARIDALPSSLAGLEQGMSWHAQYQAQLLPYARQSNELATLLPYFMERRGTMLAQNRPALLGLIEKATDREALNSVQGRYLMKDDFRTEAGAALSVAIAQRLHEIDRSVALGRPMAPQSDAPPVPAAPKSVPVPSQGERPSGEEPSEEVMYDLVRSVLVEATERQNALMVQCSRGVRDNDPLMNQTCAMLMLYKGVTTGITTDAQPPKILEFEKLGCAPAVGKAGYMCDYTLAVEQQLNPAFVGPEAKALLEGSTLKAARFIESRKGWLMIYSDEAVR